MQAVSSWKDGTFLLPDLKNNSDGDKELLWSVLSKCDITNINTGELSYYIEMKKREKD